MNDIMQERSALAAELTKTRKSSDIEQADEVLTKPSPFLTIRDIVARYSRGELVSVPEKLVEQPVFDDDIEHLEAYKSSLDERQRVFEFREEYEKAKEARRDADEREYLQQRAETVSEGTATGNDE